MTMLNLLSSIVSTSETMPPAVKRNLWMCIRSFHFPANLHIGSSHKCIAWLCSRDRQQLRIVCLAAVSSSDLSGSEGSSDDDSQLVLKRRRIRQTKRFLSRHVLLKFRFLHVIIMAREALWVVEACRI
ncbi:unnamed protein product [Gongylonema pulchrum]|uniref:Secreted protein n=1 Tax=Gongylonema pulchrum TaxID=637853 RepID=A0A183DI46_9BILA|nr:unnamed protein product [Gongylonema pulchrum]